MCVAGAHPGDNIAPLIAVAQQMGCDGAALVRAIAVAYEVQVALVKGMPLAPTQKEQTAFVPGHDGRPGGAAGVARRDDLSRPESAVLLAFSPRQTRTGDMTSWKAFVPGYSGKLAIEAMDRAMRGEASPSPVYEGQSGVIALPAGRAGGPLYGGLTGTWPPAPGDPGDVYQGALGGQPRPGLHRSGR